MSINEDVLKLTDLIYKQLKLLPPSADSNAAIAALGQLLFIVGDLVVDTETLQDVIIEIANIVKGIKS